MWIVIVLRVHSLILPAHVCNLPLASRITSSRTYLEWPLFRKTMLSRVVTRGVSGRRGLKTYILEYHYVDGMLEKRGPVRPKHLEFAQKMVEKKVFISLGACLPKAETGILLLRGDLPDVEKFAKEDPYVTSGLVTKYTIREWAVAVGSV